MLRRTIHPQNGGPAVQLSYTGAEIGDGSPAGAVLALFAAQIEGDREACMRLLDSGSAALIPADGVPPPPFVSDAVIHLLEVLPCEDRATLNFSIECAAMGPQAIPLGIGCVQEAGTWKVDLVATATLAFAQVSQGFDAMATSMGDAQALLEELAQKLNGLGEAKP